MECPFSDLTEVQSRKYLPPGIPLEEKYPEFQDSLF